MNLKGVFLLTLQLLLYPSLITILALFLLLTVPRKALRSLMPYGVVLGGLLDFVFNVVLGGLFKVFSYESAGFFVASGHLLFAPLAWTLVTVFYFYFWPQDNRNLGYFYGFSWALLATGFSQVVHKLELFRYLPWYYPLPMFVVFLVRFILVTWIAKPWRADW